MSETTIATKYENLDYFDQFIDTTVDLTEYLQRFLVLNPGLVNETKFDFSNMQPILTTVKNLFEQIQVVNTFKQNVSFFYTYSVEPGMRLETVSEKFYGVRDFWWVIAIFNNIKNPLLDWPLTEAQLVRLADKLSQTENLYSKQVYYRLLEETNEKKRNVVVPKKATVPDIIWEYRSTFAKYYDSVTI